MSEATHVGGALSGRYAAGEGFQLGRALSRAASIFGQGLVKFIILTAIAYVPLLLLNTYAGADPRSSPGLRIAAPFVQIVVNSISTATCLFGAYQIMRGRAFTIGESLSVAFGRFWPVVGASLLGGLFTGLLSLLLVVPGIMYMCAIYVALPACVIESLGPRTSLSRSQELTKGYRWQIFALVLLVTAGSLLFGIGLGFLVGLVGGFAAGAVGSSASATVLATTIGPLVAEVMVGAFAAVLQAVVYHDLRVVREGLDIEGLASVFD